MRLVDASGLKCPLPVLKARKALATMNPGETLRLIATDEMAIVDVPVFCAHAGHRILTERRTDHASASRLSAVLAPPL